MMPVHPYEAASLRLPSDRFYPELRAYLRDEYRADMGWLDHLVRSKRPPLRIRLHRWLAARQPRREGEPRDASSAAISLTPSPRSAAHPVDCPHPLIEDLGFGGDAEFLRCTVCGDVLVTRGAIQWRIRPAKDDVAPSPSDRRDGEAVFASPDEL